MANICNPNTQEAKLRQKSQEFKVTRDYVRRAYFPKKAIMIKIKWKDMLAFCNIEQPHPTAWIDRNTDRRDPPNGKTM